MTRPTITIAPIRAMDIEPGDVIRLSPTDKWRWVYDGGEDQDTDDARRIANEDLDQRYVVVRVSDDPTMKIVERPDGVPEAWKSSGPGLPAAGLHPGVPGEFDDKLVVLRQFDLVDVQLPRPDREPRQEQVVSSVTAADVDELAGRVVTGTELARIAKAIGHSSIPQALSEVVFAVCGSSEADEDDDDPLVKGEDLNDHLEGCEGT